MNYYGGNYGGYYGGGYSPHDYRADLLAAQKSEKKALGKNAAKLGALLLIYNALNYIYLDLYYILSASFLGKQFIWSLKGAKKYLVEEQADIIEGSSFSMTGNLSVIGLSAITLVIIAVLIMKIDLKSMLKPYKGCVKQGIEWIPTCVLLNVLIGIVVAMFVMMMSSNGVTIPEADFTITSQTTYAVVIQFVYVCLIGPVIEEVVYRGMIIKLLSPFGKGIAVFFSAFIFGIMHGNIPQAASAFAGSLVYAAIAVRYDSIVPTIIMHVANNLLASTIDIGTALGLDYAETVYTVLQIAIMFMGFYGIFVKIRPLKNEVNAAEPACSLTKGKRVMLIFTNVLMIIYFLFILREFATDFLAANA